MTAENIIKKFELYVDDSTELSSQEELDLLNKIYHKVLDDRPWEFLKKEWETTTDGTQELTLPTDFGYFVDNYNYTRNDITTELNQSPKVVLVDNDYYRIINWSNRKKNDGNNTCYVDIVNGKLKFSKSVGSGKSVSADYIYIPDDLTTSDEPVIPARFQDILYHGMCVDDMIIQIFEKARSYANENQAMYNRYLADLAYWNSQLLNY